MGGAAIAPGVPNSAVDATVAADQRFSFWLCERDNSPVHLRSQMPATCLPPVAIAAVPKWHTSRAVLHGVESRD